MTAAMILIQRLLPRSSRLPLEPRQITDTLLSRVDVGTNADEKERRSLALAAHFGFGATAGAVYPVFDHVCGRLPARGPAYGVAVFLSSYIGWLPAFGFLPPPDRRPRGRNVLLIASHLVWGATLQALYSGWTTNGRS